MLLDPDLLAHMYNVRDYVFATQAVTSVPRRTRLSIEWLLTMYGTSTYARNLDEMVQLKHFYFRERTFKEIVSGCRRRRMRHQVRHGLKSQIYMYLLFQKRKKGSSKELLRA